MQEHTTPTELLRSEHEIILQVAGVLEAVDDTGVRLDDARVAIKRSGVALGETTRHAHEQEGEEVLHAFGVSQKHGTARQERVTG